MAVGVLDPRKGIVWQDSGSSLTPEQIEQLQALEIRKRMGGVDTSPVNHWTQGAARVVDALGGVLRERRLNNAASENQSYNQELASPLIDALSGASSPMASASTSGVAQEMAATAPVDVSTNGDTFEPFIGTVKSAITNPYGLAAVASTGKAESGWSSGNANRSWSDPSQSGQPGTAGGILSWRGPRLAALQSYASQKGEKGNGSPQTQAEFFLREDPKLVQTLNSAKSVEEAQSAINRAWAFAGYDKPGGEAGRRLQYARSYLPQLQGSAQVASASPAAAAIEAAAPTSGYVDPMVSTPAYVAPQASAPVTSPPVVQALEAPAPQSGFDAGRFGDAPVQHPIMGGAPEIYSAQSDFAPELPAPVNVAPAPAVAAVQQPQMAPQPQAPATNTAAIAQALRVMSDPRANEGTRRVAQVLLQQEQQKQAAAQEQSVWQQRQQYEQQQQNSDPLRQLQIQKAQQELAGGSRQSLVNAGDGRIYDPNSQQWITAPDAASGNFRQATPDEVKAFGTNGQVGPDGKFYPITPPQGTALSVDPTTGAVTFNQGAGVKPLTEAQSKDSFFTTRMTAATPTIDKFESALMSLPEAAAGAIPMNLGRYAQSEEFQLAKDAGRDFVNAYLRKDSGAALTAQEEENYGQLLLPQPGDKPAILAAKRQRRQVAVQAIQSGMPPSAVDGVLKAINSVPGADKPAETTSEKKTRTGVQWSID